MLLLPALQSPTLSSISFQSRSLSPAIHLCDQGYIALSLCQFIGERRAPVDAYIERTSKLLHLPPAYWSLSDKYVEVTSATQHIMTRNQFYLFVYVTGKVEQQ